MEFKNSFIHFGGYWCPDLFKEIKNIGGRKPKGGLWATPSDCHDWEDLIKLNFLNEVDSLSIGFNFQVSNPDKIYIIDSDIDLFRMPYQLKQWSPYGTKTYIDFEKMSLHYDGILLTQNGQTATEYCDYGIGDEFNLKGWDVCSLLVLNEECIINVREFNREKFRRLERAETL